jgi:hypothetical protein
MGGRESADTVRARKQRWIKKNRASFRRRKVRENLSRNRRFQKNDTHKWERWTQREDAAITASDRPSDSVLSASLGRSLQAIEMRRSRLRL